MDRQPGKKIERDGHLTTQQRLDRALQNNTGDVSWRRWKEAETRQVLELDRKSKRMSVLDICFRGDLNIAYRVEMPVPRWPQDGRLRIGDEAVFHLNYREQWRYETPAGWEPLGLFQPLDIFHSNCAPALRGAICLGELANVSPSEIILRGYYALTLQDVVLDESDPHGVLNTAACEFFRNHPEHLPLTHAGLFDPWEPADRESEVPV